MKWSTSLKCNLRKSKIIKRTKNLNKKMLILLFVAKAVEHHQLSVFSTNAVCCQTSTSVRSVRKLKNIHMHSWRSRMQHRLIKQKIWIKATLMTLTLYLKNLFMEIMTPKFKMVKRVRLAKTGKSLETMLKRSEETINLWEQIFKGLYQANDNLVVHTDIF